jgi:hypothetical protein
MRNEIAKLVTNTKKRNDRGFEEVVQTKSREIFVEESSVGIVEKYEAQRAGIDVTLVLKADSLEYEDASQGQRPDSVEYNGHTYTIHDIRRERNSAKTMEIVCRG